MWCCHCKQDVPAVARSVDGPLVCVLCETDLEGSVCDASLGESGIELQSLDRSQENLTRPTSVVDQEATSQQLRRIGRKLQTPFPTGPTLGTSPALRADWEHAVLGIQETVPQQTSKPERSTAAPTKMSWAISLLLSAGVAGFFGGVGLLAWATLYHLPKAWQWGMTTTLAAEGMLVVGLVWMARRLWSNGRRVNRQLVGVDRQLAEVQQLAGSSAASRGSSSSYYHHFSQGASTEMLVADLRGQMEQLAARTTTS